MGKKSKSKKSNQKKRPSTTVNPVAKRSVVTPGAKENANPQPVTVAAPVLSVAAPVAPLAQRQSLKNSSLPAPLASIFNDLSPKQQVLLKILCSSLLGQAHLFANWPTVDGDLESKLKCVKQLETLHESCGLMGYISDARKQQSSTSKSSSKSSTSTTVTLEDTKTLGFAFAEGGKNGDLQSYAKAVLKTQHTFSGGKLSLCIMTTNQQKTLDSLGKNSYHGFGKDNVTILQQSENVPVLDKDFKLMTTGYYTIMTQPVLEDPQAFFFSSKVTRDWTKKGIQYITFLDQTFITADTSMMKAYRLDDSRAPTTIKFVKTTPPPVELISEPVVTTRGIIAPAESTKIVDKAIDFENVPSISAPAEKEELENKASDECSCVIL